MLTDLFGMRLLLLAGNPIPLPAPASLTQALTMAEVTQSDDGDAFQMTFTLSKDLLLDYSLLSSGALDLFSRVSLSVILAGVPQTLINGVITHHQVQPSGEPGRTTLTVTGRDVTLLMDLEEKNKQYPNRPDFLIVGEVLAGYPLLGFTPPVLIPTPDLPLIIQRIPRQAETDLAFIRRLAKRNGYVFHVNPVGPFISLPSFAPETRFALPAPALTMNSITSDNLTSLHFGNDGMAATGASGTFIDPFFKLPIPIPPLPSLRIPPLASSPTAPKRTEQLRESANETPSRALISAAAAVTNAVESVSGRGEVDTARYGSVLRARGLVGVRGVGLSYDGFYYVREVTHHIEIGKYTQSFVISREGTGTLTPAVIP